MLQKYISKIECIAQTLQAKRVVSPKTEIAPKGQFRSFENDVWELSCCLEF